MPDRYSHTPAAYGHMYEDATGGATTITIASQDTPVGWTNAVQGVVVGVTTDTSDATADHFTINAAGDYLVMYSCSCAPATVSQAFEWAVYTDGTEEVETVSYGHNVTTGGSFFPIWSGQAILTLANGAELSLRTQNRSGTGNIDVAAITFTVLRVG